MLADELQQRLHCDTFEITELHHRKSITILWDVIFHRDSKIRSVPVPLNLYDHLVLISPIWAGHIASPLKAFIKKERTAIGEYSFITICGGRNKKIFNELISLTGKRPRAFTELEVDSLLPPEKRNTIKYTSGYRIKKGDFLFFEDQISSFLRAAVPHAETDQQLE